MKWNPYNPIRYLPDNIKILFIGQADCLLYDLKENKLEVVLVEAPKKKHPGHMIRQVENENISWYRELYHNHKYFRRDRSIKALTRIKNNQDRQFNSLPFKYDAIYRQLIKDRLIDGYIERDIEVFPDETARLYFLEDIINYDKDIPF